jgi:hypothetical protein
MASVSPTVATAFGPSRPTQKTFTTAKTDSSATSSTIGTASNSSERPIGPAV